MKIKALILAAGFGSRLIPLTNDYPKCLVEVNGKPIIIKQLENLYENSVTDITIVSGYKSEILEKKIRAQYPDIHIICSVDYATTNNMYSAYIAKEAMNNEGFLMLNGDVFFDSSVISNLLEFKSANAIVTDIGTYMEESMKVVENDGKLTKISKTISPEEALGSSIDIYKFSPEAAKIFFDKCSEYIEKKELKLWSEVALNDILPKIEFRACPLVGRWYEIDTLDDLETATKIFK